MDDTLRSFFVQLGEPSLLVLGDLILDRYSWGDAERISPEAPVIVLRADAEETRLGGAASTAFLLRGLQARVTLAGVLGNDSDGQSLLDSLDGADIVRSAVLADPDRRTTVKNRFVGRAGQRHPHQILRVDYETRRPITSGQEDQLLEHIVKGLPQSQCLLISDYGKGVCTPALLGRVIGAARDHGVPVLVDPARGADFDRYRGADLIAPNRTEAQAASGRRIETPDDAMRVGRMLGDGAGILHVVVKLDQDGLVLVSAGEPPRHFPTRSRSVYDVTGAGDMVLAVLGLARAAHLPWETGAALANVAAGLEVEKQGISLVSRAEIWSELSRSAKTGAGKLVSLEQMAVLAESYRRTGRKIVFTNGCFDLLHIGHVACLEEASQQGDVLVVAVNSNAGVQRLKGPDRPVVSQEDRAALLASLACVDHVLIFDDPTPHELLLRIRPDVLAKGGTYAKEAVVGSEVVEGYGGQVCVTHMVLRSSTTAIIAGIRGQLFGCGHSKEGPA